MRVTIADKGPRDELASNDEADTAAWASSRGRDGWRVHKFGSGPDRAAKNESDRAGA